MLPGRFLALTVGIFVVSLAVVGCEAITTFLPPNTSTPGPTPTQESGATAEVAPTVAALDPSNTPEAVNTPTAVPAAPPIPEPTATTVPADTPVPQPTPTATPLPPPSFTSLNSGTSQRLRDVAWKPDGSYALLVGDGGTIIKFDGSGFTALDSGTTTVLRSVDWKPDGSSALIAGGTGAANGLLLEFDGDSVTEVSRDPGPNLVDAVWKPDGSYALLVGSRGLVQRYDGTRFTPVDAPSASYSGVGFKTDGSLAIVTDFSAPSSGPVTYDGDTIGRRVPIGLASNLQDVAWKSDGSYGLVVGSGGALLKYDGIEVTSHFPDRDVWFYGVDWRMDDSQALVVGGIAEFIGNYPESSVVISFDGTNLVDLSPDLANGKILYGVAWHPKGVYALIVGKAGTVLRFQPSAPPGLPAIARLPRVDQSYSPSEYTFGQGFGGFDIGQTFVPELTDLVAVELPICTGTDPDEVEVQIRDGVYDGPILGSVKLTLDAPFCGFGEEQFSRFAFDEPVTLVPGQTYVIRLHSVTPSDAGTFGAPDGYSGGHLFRFENGQPFAAEDLGFRTYAKPAAPS